MEETEIAKAQNKLVDYVKEKYPDVAEQEPTLERVFALCRYAYQERTGLKKGCTVDVIVKDGKISFKDMGQNYQILAQQQYLEALRQQNDGYETTQMIGMNYSGIVL